ncbi:PREDICTED: uncharacterized protein LOC102839544 [Chrysochloris asiatica]|uniref:Uncharacterized protein LOC102839544 n=2 Tax=Eutheria TaxID=9347 RepID=A0A9B0T8C2_CHRAS|nr:PREDICTED: uncharacterized protein LOC102839544 [Chrysochloris asiatica]
MPMPSDGFLDMSKANRAVSPKEWQGSSSKRSPKPQQETEQRASWPTEQVKLSRLGDPEPHPPPRGLGLPPLEVPTQTAQKQLGMQETEAEGDTPISRHRGHRSPAKLTLKDLSLPAEEHTVGSCLRSPTEARKLSANFWAKEPPSKHAGATEVEEILKRIQSHKGVIGTMVVNAEGIPIRTTLDNSTTVQYAGLLHQLTMKAKSTVRDIDPQNDLTFLRIRSKKHEIMVAPDKEYLLIVIQNPCE